MKTTTLLSNKLSDHELDEFELRELRGSPSNAGSAALKFLMLLGVLTLALGLLASTFGG
jgi:hypothetical protein